MPYSITKACTGCTACVRKCPVGAITGERKKVHKIDPDLCIDCGVCGRICPAKGAVLDNLGNTCTFIKPALWQRPEIDIKTCTSCNICIDTCPLGCISLSKNAGARDNHGYPYLSDEKACIGCGFCAADCPVDAIVMRVPTI